MSSQRPIDQPERRASKRFSIERTISYRVLGRGPVGASGSGKTVNMSSGGMLIETEQVLLPGWRVEVEVSGPFQVDDQVSFKLLVTGKITRSVGSPNPMAGLKISRHTFQTSRAD